MRGATLQLVCGRQLQLLLSVVPCSVPFLELLQNDKGENCLRSKTDKCRSPALEERGNAFGFVHLRHDRNRRHLTVRCTCCHDTSLDHIYWRADGRCHKALRVQMITKLKSMRI